MWQQLRHSSGRKLDYYIYSIISKTIWCQYYLKLQCRWRNLVGNQLDSQLCEFKWTVIFECHHVNVIYLSIWLSTKEVVLFMVIEKQLTCSSNSSVQIVQLHSQTTHSVLVIISVTAWLSKSTTSKPSTLIAKICTYIQTYYDVHINICICVYSHLYHHLSSTCHNQLGKERNR